MNDEIKSKVMRIEGPFRTWDGRIDILSMSNQLCGEHFREYIALSRALRGVREPTQKPVLN
jgi:hypothetical protein